jgi:hypothetical protein
MIALGFCLRAQCLPRRRLVGEVSRFDDALWHRQTSRTRGGDAGPESIANPSKHAGVLGFATLTASLHVAKLESGWANHIKLQAAPD